jgi:hypothetical protein
VGGLGEALSRRRRRWKVCGWGGGVVSGTKQFHRKSAPAAPRGP